MRGPRSMSWRYTTVLSVFVLAVALALPSAPPLSALTPCASPPPVYPISSVANGQTATGWTVLQGTTPESFTVTLLGVLHDAIAPGRDAILVKASGANIDAIGGMGPGFSGSPVYRDNQLVGSVSYGLGGDPHYGALTPGQDLVDVLMQPGVQIATDSRIRLSRETRTLIARDAGVQLDAVSTSLWQIPLPLASPAVSDKRIQQMTDRFAARGVSVEPYQAGSTSASPTVTATDPIAPGDVFVAAVSYGSIAWAALGTATIACGDYVVAFGHAFTQGGSGLIGAVLDGEIVATIPASAGWVPFKMGNIGALQGALEQDRLAGVRGVMGVAPLLTEISSSITNLDTGKVRTTTTQVAREQWLAGIAGDHMWNSVYSTMDADRGTTVMSWTIILSSLGQQYQVDLRNAYSGRRALYGPASDVDASIRSLQRADGPAHIISVHVTATVTERQQAYAITPVRTSSTSAPTFTANDTIDVHRRDTLRVRVPLRQSDTGEVHDAETTFSIPMDATGDGRLTVRTGQPDFWIDSLSLEDTIAWLEAMPSTTDLLLKLRMGGAHTQTRALPQSLPVSGGDEVQVHLIRG